MNHEKKLGRGLDFLLSETSTEPESDELLHVPEEKISPNRFQPRKEFKEGELKDLSASIKANGILQPLVARRTESGFELIAGERRLRAARLAGLDAVPVVVKEATDEQLLSLAMIENIQRENLNPIEKAKACKQLLTLTGKTQEELASRLGMSRPSFANHLRLLDLPTEIQEHVSRGTLSMGHARALLAVNELERSLALAESCSKEGWSVREMEAKVKGDDDEKAVLIPSQPRTPTVPSWHRELQERLSQALSARVQVKFRGEKAHMTIETGTREEFDNLFDRLVSLPDMDIGNEPTGSMDNILM